MRLYKRLDKFLLNFLRISRSDEAMDKKTVVGSIILTVLVLGVVYGLGLRQDIIKGIFSQNRLIEISLLVLLGLIVGILLMLGIIWLIRRYPLIRGWPPIIVVALIAIVFSGLAVWVIKFASVAAPTLIGLSFTMALFGLMIELIPLSRSYFTFQHYVLARIGIIIFIASKILHLINPE